MAYDVSRAELRARLIREGRLESEQDENGIADMNRALQDAWNLIHADLAGVNEGYASTTQSFTVLADSDTLELPSVFRALRAIRRRPSELSYPPVSVKPEEVDDLCLDEREISLPGFFQIEGPGTEYDENTLQYVYYPQRLRFWPSLEAGEVVRLRFSTAPTSLGDPADPNQDGTTIDVIDERVAGAIVALARITTSKSEDQTGYQRAIDAARAAVAESRKAPRMRNAAGVERLSQHRRATFKPWTY